MEARAAGARWSRMTLNGEPALCMWIDAERAAVITKGSAGAEVLYPAEFSEDIADVPTPDASALACWMAGIEPETLERLASFCSEPRTMNAIEEHVEGLEIDAYWLRRLGLLRDVGRQGREIASVWDGVKMEPLLKEVFDAVDEADAKLRKMYGDRPIPRPQRDDDDA